MIKRIPERSTSMANGKWQAQLTADTAAELGGVTRVGDMELDAHSVALTADGKLCMLGSGGVWHDMGDGSEIAPPENTPGGDA